MYYKTVWLKLVLAVLLFFCILLVDQLETPWSQQIVAYLRYSLSEESSWEDISFDRLPLGHIEIGSRLQQYKDEILQTLDGFFNTISQGLRHQIQQILPEGQ